MNQNVELDRWRLLWQARAEGPDAADLRDRVVRDTHRRRIALMAPVLVTLVIGGGTIARAVVFGGLENIAVAMETWLFMALIWAGAVWIDRGTWQPLRNTTAAFVDMSIRRCQSDISGLRFAAILYIGQFIAVLALKRYLSSAAPLDLMTAWPVVVLGWLGFPVFLMFVLWYGRRKKRTLVHLLQLRQQLTED